MIETQPTDLQDRVTAAADLGRNIAVSAGAGTGKTTLLIDRLVMLLLGKETPVDRIVALTFTKKAAEEMRDRLESRLRALIEKPDGFELLNERFPSTAERRRALAERALDDIPKAQIGTIHSFAGHLLRLYPVQAQVDPGFREDEGDAFEAAFEPEWRAWLSSELADGAPRAAQWKLWLGALDLADLRALAEALARSGADLGALKRKVDVRPVFAECAARLDDLVRRLGVPPAAPAFAAGLDAMKRIFEQAGGPKPISADGAERAKKIDPPKSWQSDEAAVARLKELGKIAAAAASIDDAAVAAALSAVAPFVRRLRSELGRRGVVSFDDLLLKARDLVRDHKSVRAALKKQYTAFLVDEFQDTDPLQGEILFYLAEAVGHEADDWRGVRLGAGRLFLVGDPKQSIYRFRGADIAAFEEFWGRMIQQGAIEARLTNNFRSEGQILAFVNEIFPPVMTAQPFVQPAYEPLVCATEAPRIAGCEFIHVSVPDGEKALAAEHKAFEAELLADWIATAAGRPLNGEELRYRDIAILMRTTTAFEPYLDALRRRGIPFLAEGEKSYYRRPEIAEFANLLAVVADPADRMSLLGVLRSPVGGLNDAEILELADAGGLTIQRTPPLFADKVGRLFSNLRDLSQQAAALPVPEAIRLVLDMTWILETAAARRFGEQALANLRKAARLAERWLETGPLSLQEFVRRLRAFAKEQKEEGDNPLADVQYDAVRVMTVHKAKGLEFRAVFLPNICGESGAANNGRTEPIRRDWRTELVGARLPGAGVCSSARFLIDQEVAHRESAEEVRVFYVATTRAKEKLVMICREDPPGEARFAEFLSAAGAYPAADAADVRLKGVSVPVTQKSWKDAEAPGGARPALTLSPAWAPAVLAPALLRRKEEEERCRSQRLLLTPTAVMNEENTDVKERRAFANDDEALDRAPAIRVGHLCHSVLEAWDFSLTAGKAGATLDKALRSAALRLEIDDAKEVALIDEASSILSGFFASDLYRRLASVEIVGREIPFFYPLPGAGDAPRLMRGVMDLLYREKGRLVVADYKTNRLPEKESPAKIAKRYAEQGKIYLEAVRRATGEAGEFELILLRSATGVRLG